MEDMGLLFAALELVITRVLVWIESECDRLGCGLQSLGEVLPEVLDGDGETSLSPLDGYCWSRAETGAFRVAG